MSPDDDVDGTGPPPATDIQGDATRLLRRVRDGDGEALDRLVAMVYGDLRQVAARQLRHERQDHTLHATALVHEAYVRLAGGDGLDVTDRTHFLAVAARAMRQVLVDHARRRNAAKRGGGWTRTTLTSGDAVLDVDAAELLALDRALDELDERQRQVVEMRFFGGMEEEEIGAFLGVSSRTVRRDWVKARAWLYRSMYPDGDGPGNGSGDLEPPDAGPGVRR
ncbi:MAG: sigma-70 family RNA polymerase sigma factor [Gemmatimonadetes bacterium]|nr:sigma-70 family RNA polymerase sigma factor [Gemmatimonadota bacterium]